MQFIFRIKWTTSRLKHKDELLHSLSRTECSRPMDNLGKLVAVHPQFLTSRTAVTAFASLAG